MTSDRPPLTALLAVAVTLLLWASAFVVIRDLGEVFSAGPLSLGRLIVGSAVLAAIALRYGVPRPTGRQWVSIVLIGTLWYGLYNVALNAGEQLVDAGTAAMLIQVAPVLIAAMAAVFLSEPFTRWVAAGLVIAFTGVALIGLSSSEAADRDPVGVLLCLLAAVAYAISLVLQKPLVAQVKPIHVTWLACTVGAACCLPYLPGLLAETSAASGSDLLLLIYLGVFPTAIAFSTFAYALGHMTAGSLSITTYLVPPITIVMAWLALGETPPPVAYVGGALAMAGVALSRRKSRVPASSAESVSGRTRASL